MRTLLVLLRLLLVLLRSDDGPDIRGHIKKMKQKHKYNTGHKHMNGPKNPKKQWQRQVESM